MLIQLVLSILIGILTGTFTGLIPGIHINLIGAFIISSTVFLTRINPLYTLTFIVSMAITHTFVDFIPSIFLGCPDTDTELSVLPGHDLLKQGYGHEAVMLTAYGSIVAVFIFIILSYPASIFFQFAQNLIQNYIAHILILVSILLILTERNKFQATKIFILTGILGLIILNLEINQPLLPLLTGLFGGSMLILSIKNKTKIPKQKTSEKFKPRLFKPLLSATISAPLCSFLPGLGSGQAAIIGSTITKKGNEDKKSFLTLVGATNTLVMGFSFISLYAISRTRTGAAAAINEIVGKLTPKTLVLIIFTIFISGIISFYITKFISKKASENIEKINYRKTSLATLSILFLIVLIVSRFEGVLVFVASTLTGIYAMEFNIKKTNMMGSIIVPVIFFYLF